MGFSRRQSAPAKDVLNFSEGQSDREIVTVRDEVGEIKKASRGDTLKVRRWRIFVTVLLAVTGIAVSISTYIILVRQEEKNFEDAYEQFSRTVADAAEEEIRQVLEALRTFAETITATAVLSNTTWPYYDYPAISIFAEEQVLSKGLESINIFTRIEHADREFYFQEFEAARHERWVKEGHFRSNGDLSNLEQSGYTFDIFGITDQGVGTRSIEEFYYSFTFRYPPPNSYFTIGFDIRSVNYDDLFFAFEMLRNQTLITNVNPYIESDDAERRYHAQFHSQLPGSQVSHPHSFIFHPVHAELENPDSEIVAAVSIPLPWDAALRNLLPENVRGILAITRNNCGQDFTYLIDGRDAFYLGEGDTHSSDFDGQEVVVNLDFHDHDDFFDYPGHCVYTLSIFPNNDFRNEYLSPTPRVFVVLVSMTFLVMIAVFYVYDWYVQRRNSKLIENAARSNEIVTSMFPGELRTKIIEQRKASGMKRRHTTDEITSLVDGGGPLAAAVSYDSDPLAELYLDTTVLFADVVGFTAWSSVREPTHVFRLLETVYHSFDEVARQRRVFKVETVGDCYVAVTGFPAKQKDHAVRMCRYAKSIMNGFQRLVRELETSLGPDTGDLGMRIGIHSGPVTAGVLRGDRARFQLFGDTMNTTSRIESKSESGRILVSAETAELVIASGKDTWLTKRKDLIHAKGKGSLQTYWCKPKSAGFASASNASDEVSDTASLYSNYLPDDTNRDDRIQRLIEWNVSTLADLLKRVVRRREVMGISMEDFDESSLETKETFLDEVKEIIALPEFNAKSIALERDYKMVDLGTEVITQLREYVVCLGNLYRQNAFHNFEHASHVVMSVTKLLSRIVAPSDIEFRLPQEKAPGDNSAKSNFEMNFESTLHDHTYGITSDPLTHFACAFSALIHDVDHSGVPNPRLIEENPLLGDKFKKRSVAEQNSLEIAWSLLMDDNFQALRRTIYATEAEMCRFRELIVNSVMATDISDKDLKDLRNGRWDKAFPKEPRDTFSELEMDTKNRKATIVIEHLIQASDVAHTMQHWHIYRKWNERLFTELYVAWQKGRAAKNPAEFWAKGEIGFFDFYVIPLAKKLKDCGVFGISSDEYLQYAEKNRKEWTEKGDSVVGQMVERLNKKDEDDLELDDEGFLQELTGDLNNHSDFFIDANAGSGPLDTIDEDALQLQDEELLQNNVILEEDSGAEPLSVRDASALDMQDDLPDEGVFEQDVPETMPTKEDL